MNGTLVYNFTLDNQYPPPMIQYDPERWIAYFFAGVFFLALFRTTTVMRATKCMWLGAASFASVLLFTSMILRGAMGRTEADSFRMYEAMNILHLISGFILNGMLLIFAAKWIEVSSKGMVGVFLQHMGIAYTVTVAVCTSIGVPLSFDKMEWRRISGYRLVSISLIVSIGFSVLAGLLALYHTESSKNNNEIGATRDRLPIILTPTVFMIIWMSFEIARVSLPMDYAANSSDAMFYCLSALPATCIILAWNNGIEEFLCLVAVGTNSNATGDGANRQGNEDYRLQEVVSRTASPSSKAAVAADGGGCCCNSNGKSRCAKCKYEAMLQHAMSKYT